jgi:phosphatidylserine decarboxylase
VLFSIVLSDSVGLIHIYAFNVEGVMEKVLHFTGKVFGVFLFVILQPVNDYIVLSHSALNGFH